jgi:hypothetical protein
VAVELEVVEVEDVVLRMLARLRFVVGSVELMGLRWFSPSGWARMDYRSRVWGGFCDQEDGPLL